MGNYVEVSLKHLINGGSQSCLKKICSGGSDLKIGCAWPQFRGHRIDAIDRVEYSINWTYHTRHDDQIAKATYFIFDKIEDATKLMSLKLDYGNKQIDLYQKVKPEEDITGVGHWKSDCEVLNKIIYEKKARKGANKMGFVFNSTEPEKTVGLESTAPIIKNLPFETAAAIKTNDENDDYEELSDYERSSSPIEIKKEHIIFNNNQSDSDGNKTPSEHSIMAGKTRLGLIPQKEILNYVSSVDRVPQGANVTNMELESIPPGDTGPDTEMRQNTD
ncbi:hypothetical protein AYI70_g10712 [Smittium culicis]|uniref:Uncharacterized protein n=1 Tax=Smittium culicis TaxID=133412 RepID=A0A1R1X5G2_9FUNG|nr:hypothetical protein AYI70_g10712 [Smittium culicis]